MCYVKDEVTGIKKKDEVTELNPNSISRQYQSTPANSNADK